MQSSRVAADAERENRAEVHPAAETDAAEGPDGQAGAEHLPALPGLIRRAAAGVADPLGGTAVPASLGAALHRRSGTGRPLPTPLADRIGQELGHDLGGVRVHTDAEASGIARSVQAVAFTHGSDIYFQQGRYAPDSADGLHLLAHELSHVAHEAAAGRTGGAVIGRADDPAERAADDSAARVVGALRRRQQDRARQPAVADVRAGSVTDVRAGSVVDALRRRAAIRRAAAAPGVATAGLVIRRAVQIRFQSRQHEMDDPVDPLTAKITFVEATRTPSGVATEDGWPGMAQNAHTTSHAVMTYMWVRELHDKTWVQAWQLVRERLVFLEKLLAAWYSDSDEGGVAEKARRDLKGGLTTEVTRQLRVCDEQLSRGGHSVTGEVWGAKPKAGDSSTWQYYDHRPTPEADSVSEDTHNVRQWKPLLDSENVGKLQDACEQWMKVRGQIPWTSVEAESYVTGDRTGPDGVHSAAGGLSAKDALTDEEAESVAKPILKTFDFFPAKLTGKRTLTHAAGVAARHLVEHFEYHPNIKVAWRVKVKEQFLELWKARITQHKLIEDTQHQRFEEANQEQSEEESEEESGSKKKRKQPPKQSKAAAKKVKVVDGRETSALDDLLEGWDEVETEFNRLYTLLAGALTRS